MKDFYSVIVKANREARNIYLEIREHRVDDTWGITRGFTFRPSNLLSFR